MVIEAFTLEVRDKSSPGLGLQMARAGNQVLKKKWRHMHGT